MRIAVRTIPGQAIRRKRFERHDPRRDRRREALGQEWTQRLIFPGLNIARRPIIQQAKPEHVRFRVADRYAIPQFIAGADEDSELELVIDAFGRRDHRRLRAWWKNLSDGTTKFLSRDAYRRSATVIGNRHPFVVRQQRIVGAHQPADAGRVVNRRIEVAVIADVRRKRMLSVILCHETAVQPIRER